ncbi:MAG: flagellar hook-basal body complex protein FliE [Alphaproteobacteria bacterium]|nr:MAG: flagellar hook-basal body complex protein FliE [Alphaproteobacteria bacterium]
MAETNALAATQAYSRALAQKPLDTATSVGEGEAAPKVSFSDLLSEVGKDTVDSLNASEQAGIKSMTDKAGLADIVTAVSNAEATLETVVAVRDRVIQAYQDIIKMPI